MGWVIRHTVAGSNALLVTTINDHGFIEPGSEEGAISISCMSRLDSHQRVDGRRSLRGSVTVKDFEAPLAKRESANVSQVMVHSRVG